MEGRFKMLILVATVSTTLGQQNPPTGPSSPLGVKYSASTDVSHVSFNSPLVTYGEALSEIRLPAAPIQPANLKELPKNQGDVGALGQPQQLQIAPEQQQKYISIQQYPANPQLQNNDQGFSLSQSLPAAQPQQRFTAPIQLPVQPQQQFAPQPQQQYVLPQPTAQQYLAAQQPYVQPQTAAQQYLAAQQPYVQQPQTAAQQYLAAQQPYVQQPQTAAQQYLAQQPQTVAQQPYVLPQTAAQQYVAQPQLQQYLSGQPLQYPANTGYFATGPYAAQYQPQQLVSGQVAPQPLLPQGVNPATQLVSRVAFNGPTAGFSYSF